MESIYLGKYFIKANMNNEKINRIVQELTNGEIRNFYLNKRDLVRLYSPDEKTVYEEIKTLKKNYKEVKIPTCDKQRYIREYQKKYYRENEEYRRYKKQKYQDRKVKNAEIINDTEIKPESDK